MSEAKRDQSAFQQSVAVGRALEVRKTLGSAPRIAPICANLRVLESWENNAIPSGDPYNGMGARAGTVQALRK
jgi:hypothetical protein